MKLLATFILGAQLLLTGCSHADTNTSTPSGAALTFFEALKTSDLTKADSLNRSNKSSVSIMSANMYYREPDKMNIRVGEPDIRGNMARVPVFFTDDERVAPRNVIMVKDGDVWKLLNY